MTRPTFVAGSFYPDVSELLMSELEALVPFFPEGEKEDVIGAVVPHAGFLYSGRVAGEVYSRLTPKETFVVIGPNHTGRGHKFSLTIESWDTPLGAVEVDREFAAAIRENASIVRDDPSAHRDEHSIEVQLPFIKKLFPGSRIVPICVASEDLSELRAVAESIVSSALSLERDITILASSDMTHYEPRGAASTKDKSAIDAMLEINAIGLAETVQIKRVSMCGWAPAVIMLFAAGMLGADAAKLVKYSDSGDVTGNTSEVVGYAGVTLSCSKGKRKK